MPGCGPPADRHRGSPPKPPEPTLPHRPRDPASGYGKETLAVNFSQLQSPATNMDVSCSPYEAVAILQLTLVSCVSY
jgi:hypothetical protein